jgi:hypothetical protein
MNCLSCGSSKQAELTAEMMIHFLGLEHLDKPGVLLFPKIEVCLDCGLSRFTVPETELASIAKSKLENPIHAESFSSHAAQNTPKRPVPNAIG